MKINPPRSAPPVSTTTFPAATVTAAIVASARANRCLAGCQLKRLLHEIGIDGGLGCGCTGRAALMDAGLIDADELIGQMRAEAAERGLPFVESQARWLIGLAYRLAEENREPMRLERIRLKALRTAHRLIKRESEREK